MGEYSRAERTAALIGVVFAAALLLVSLDVATGGRLSRRGATAYAWQQAAEEGEQL